jgi:hypothetical protein
MITSHYPTGRLIAKGDRVLLDGIYTGTVVEILDPKTEEAKTYACFDTGGLLINTDQFGLMTAIFGSSQEIAIQAE